MKALTFLLLPGLLLLGTQAGSGAVGAAQTPPRAPATGSRPLHFVVPTIPLHNARVGMPFRASVGGLLAGNPAGTTFSMVEGPGWLHVRRDGVIRGVPAQRFVGHTAVATVQARDAAGRRATARVQIPVRSRAAHLVPRVRIMTWNLWLGGSQVTDGREKEMRFLLKRRIDAVAVQEAFDGAARDLGRRLGWYYFQAGDDVGILSRYPIVHRSPVPTEATPVGNVKIQLDSLNHDQFSLWTTHLGYTPYGPYDACFGHYSVRRLEKREAESGRTRQITEVVKAMRHDLRDAGRQPVMLTGDFNAPSHLDWSASTDRCGYSEGVPWPTSVIPTQAGLTDTFREVHPDPVAVPGLTWSPIYKTFTGGYGHSGHAGEPEPQDRLDFIYAKGGWPVLSSVAVVAGHPALEPHSDNNEWPSDHRGVITTFAVR